MREERRKKESEETTGAGSYNKGVDGRPGPGGRWPVDKSAEWPSRENIISHFRRAHYEPERYGQRQAPLTSSRVVAGRAWPRVVPCLVRGSCAAIGPSSAGDINIQLQ